MTLRSAQTRVIWLTLVMVAAVSSAARSGAAEPGVRGALVVSDASVVVLCPMTVGGAFEARTRALDGALALDPAQPSAIDGTLTVDLRSLRTGIALRDEHMRDKYLEVDRSPSIAHATLDRNHVSGLDPSKPAGRASFRGSLTLHGRTRDVDGTAVLRRSGAGLRVEAAFPVRVSDFAIPDPTYLGVGVRNTLTVSVNFLVAPSRHP
jgi:polyisoprenoid-binding protein YceI